MRVLLVSGEFPPMVGGVGDYTACLTTALHGLGVQVSVLTFTGATASEGAFPFPVLAWVPAWSFGSWGLICRAVGVGPKGAPIKPAPVVDIVHTQYQSAAYGLHPAINLFPPYLKVRVPTIRTLVTFHDLKVPYMFPKAGPLRGWAVRSLARRSDKAICTDEADLQVVSRWRLKSPACLIPIGSNIPVVETGRWPVSMGTSETGHRPVSTGPGGEGLDKEILLGYFGLLNESKGVDVLVRALRLVTQRGLPVTMAVVGADLGDSDPTNAAYARRVHAMVGELQLEGATRWTGRLSPQDTSIALQSLDVCILPYLDGASFRRGTLMAALAHGLPLITTTPALASTAGPRLIDGENCRLVPPGDVGALALAIEELAGSPSLRERLAQGALTLARSFTWEEIARRTVALYERALSQ